MQTTKSSLLCRVAMIAAGAVLLPVTFFITVCVEPAWPAKNQHYVESSRLTASMQQRSMSVHWDQFGLLFRGRRNQWRQDTGWTLSFLSLGLDSEMVKEHRQPGGTRCRAAQQWHTLASWRTRWCHKIGGTGLHKAPLYWETKVEWTSVHFDPEIKTSKVSTF